MIFFHSIIRQVNCDTINYYMPVRKNCWNSFQIKDVLGRTYGKYGIYNFHKDNWILMKNLGVGVKTFKTKNDISMKLFLKKPVSVVSIVCMFSCLVCVMWYEYHDISMITPCKLCNLDMALVYQKLFGIVYIFAIYVFLVSHCCTWNKKTVNS